MEPDVGWLTSIGSFGCGPDAVMEGKIGIALV